ncbi:MAG: ABC transporter permease, partial [Ruminococcus sp.]|nr:ABC transporter permease [Ruminococcus sp.]
MRNPMNRRILLEIKGEAGKYFVIFIFMLAIVSIASGFFIADASLKAAYDESFTKYNIEDGNFELPAEADDELKDSIEEEGLTIYKNFYKDESSYNDSKLRIFKVRDEVNTISLLEGRMPESKSEIALDRLYMKSNDIKLNGTINAGGKDYDIVGIIALPDYSALYESNTDFMFDTEKFGVAAVTEDAFESISDNNLHYSYSWKYNDPPADRFSKEAIERSNDLIKALSQKTQLLNFIPTCRNSAIKFSGNDLGHDRIMFVVMLDMLVVIISFVFAVTTSNTIAKEANVIGTLRASGYTKGELIRHYMAAPVVVLLAASIVGNILGYTIMKGYMAEMYLGSYSLVSYDTLWNTDAFIDTTVIPLLILIAINFIMLYSKLSLSPLKFLRHDLKRRQRKKAFKLSTKIPIMTRCRIRVLLQNIPGYITIFTGLFFASTIMIFALLFQPLLDNFERDTVNSMIAEHQYILKAPVPTTNEDAEKFAAGELKIINGDFSEDVSIYGISSDSKYYHASLDKDTVYVSSAYADKYSLEAGDTITLHDEYGDKEYDFSISDIYDYPSTLAVFMELDRFNETFENDEGYFTGYLSDTEIDDVDEQYIASEITIDDLTKTSRQLKRSMGNMMIIFIVLGVAVIVLVVYLLS